MFYFRKSSFFSATAANSSQHVCHICASLTTNGFIFSKEIIYAFLITLPTFKISYFTSFSSSNVVYIRNTKTNIEATRSKLWKQSLTCHLLFACVSADVFTVGTVYFFCARPSSFGSLVGIDLIRCNQSRPPPKRPCAKALCDRAYTSCDNRGRRCVSSRFPLTIR